MMRDDEAIRREVARAQEDLERHVRDIEHYLEDRLSGPRHVLQRLRRARQLAVQHALVVLLGGLVIGALVGLVRRRAPPR
ncbi:MAG TPA: hypothetical protein VLX92_27315 [Kofleriaceae bacterium]|nr:hypothetical protein [Kofleriaceae bacterium]